MSRASPDRSRAGRRVPPAVWSALALLACLAVLGASAAGVFRVRHVDVVGAGVPAGLVAQAAGVTGQNIFTVRSDQVVRRLQALPQIEVLRVDTSFPDRVTVHARLRTPVVGWQDRGPLYLVAGDGTVIGQARTTALPVILGAAPPDPGLIEAVRQARLVLPSAPGGQVAAFRVLPGLGLTIVGRAGWTAEVGSGSAQTLVNRVVTLASILQKVGARSQRLKLVDLRYPEPYLQFAGA
jgi:cell division septal protein FtsQ